MKLRVLDLFSGIGGFSLGLERTGGFETVAFCEIEEFPRQVLAKHWPEVPCFGDISELKGSDVGPVDVICGGYPCQPFSQAGKRRGHEDDRHLWPQFIRLVDELRPSWVIGENVVGHISMGLDDVLSDLEGQGYTTRAFVIPACGKDAPHRRNRVWVVAHSACEQGSACNIGQKSSGTSGPQQGKPRGGSSEEDVSNADSNGFSGPRRAIKQVHCEQSGQREIDRAFDDSRWPTEPAVGRVANGVPFGMDRLKSLGNAVVPAIPMMIGNAILASETSQ